MLGRINLETTEFIRAADQTMNCITFEIKDKKRVYLFQASSHTEMVQWVTVVNCVLKTIAEGKIADSKRLLEQKILNSEEIETVVDFKKTGTLLFYIIIIFFY